MLIRFRPATIAAFLLIACVTSRAQDDVPGRWFVINQYGLCLLGIQGVGISSFAIAVPPDKLLRVAAVLEEPPTLARGYGTVAAVTPNRYWGLVDRFQQVTLPFKKGADEMMRATDDRANDRMIEAWVTHREFLDVLDLIERAANDRDGLLLVRYGSFEQRFMIGKGNGKIRTIRACAQTAN
jgi:hypothetical protein